MRAHGLSDNKVIAPQPHPTFNVKRACHARDFKIDSAPSAETIRRALAELERRIKKQALIKIPTKRAYKQGSGTSPALLRSMEAHFHPGSQTAPVAPTSPLQFGATPASTYMLHPARTRIRLRGAGGP